MDNNQQDNINLPIDSPPTLPETSEQRQQPDNINLVNISQKKRIIKLFFIGLLFATLFVVVVMLILERNKQTNRAMDTVESSGTNNVATSQNSDNTAQSSIEKINNNNYRFTDTIGKYSLVYPDNWTVVYEEDLYAIERQDGSAGSTATLTANSGLKLLVSFENYGGKGGDCQPEIDDKPHASGNNCPTNEILYSEKTGETVENQNNTTSDKSDLYLTREKFTDSGDAKTVYYSGLTSGDKVLFPTEPSMGYYFANSQFSFKPKLEEDIYFHYSIFMEPKGESEEYFTQKDVMEAEMILKSFKLEK